MATGTRGTVAAGDEILTPDDAADILEEILDAQNKSYFLGLKLKVAQSEVEAIHEMYTDPPERLLHILIAFLKGVEPKPTWRVIVEALRSPAVKLPALAEKVNEAHFSNTSTRDIEADEEVRLREREPQTQPKQQSSEALVERQQEQTIKKPKTEIAKVVTPQTAVNSLQDKENLVPRPSPHGTTKFFFIDVSLRDPQYDLDLTNISDGNKVFYRGGERYFRPYGWQRYALKVQGKYEDDTWLGEPGPRQYSSEGEWPVSYYGTHVKMFQTIAQKGYYGLRKAKRLQKQKRGVCSSPFIDVAAWYAKTFIHRGRTYQLVFQNRVSVERLNKSDQYWIQPHGKYIRPYAICVRLVYQ